MAEFEDFSEYEQIYTDGSYRPSSSGGCGAWGYVKVKDDEIKEQRVFGVKDTTINIMELRAILEAIKSLKPGTKAIIYSDSLYSVLSISKWTWGWKKNNWMTMNGTPVKNKEILLEIDALKQQHTLKFRHVKGHDGNTYNEIVDELVQSETKKMVNEDAKANPDKYYQTPDGVNRLKKEFRPLQVSEGSTPTQGARPNFTSKEERKNFYRERAISNGTYGQKQTPKNNFNYSENNNVPKNNYSAQHEKSKPTQEDSVYSIL